MTESRFVFPASLFLVEFSPQRALVFVQRFRLVGVALALVRSWISPDLSIQWAVGLSDRFLMAGLGRIAAVATVTGIRVDPLVPAPAPFIAGLDLTGLGSVHAFGLFQRALPLAPRRIQGLFSGCLRHDSTSILPARSCDLQGNGRLG